MLFIGLTVCILSSHYTCVLMAQENSVFGLCSFVVDIPVKQVSFSGPAACHSWVFLEPLRSTLIHYQLLRQPPMIIAWGRRSGQLRPIEVAQPPVWIKPLGERFFPDPPGHGCFVGCECVMPVK